MASSTFGSKEARFERKLQLCRKRQLGNPHNSVLKENQNPTLCNDCTTPLMKRARPDTSSVPAAILQGLQENQLRSQCEGASTQRRKRGRPLQTFNLTPAIQETTHVSTLLTNSATTFNPNKRVTNQNEGSCTRLFIQGGHSQSLIHTLAIQGREPKRSKAHSARRSLSENNDNKKELPELTSELLELIAKRQDVAGFCAFGAVCKSWLEIYNRSREDFLESQAPMAVLISSHNKRECYLHDIANGKTKKVMLPNIVSKFFVGCSAGFLILEDIYREIFLINPFTGHELKCHAPHFSLISKSLHDHIIVASTSSPKSYVILAISNTMRKLQVFHFKNSRWFTWLFLRQEWVDIAIFKGHVYVVTKNAELGELRIKATDSRRSIVFNWLTVRNTPNVNYFYLKLVVSNDQLLMVDFVPEKHLNIHKMDFDAMEWVKVDELGDQAFFFGREWGSAMRKPGSWGGQSNCVYYLDTLSNMCCLYSMEAKLIGKFPFVEDSITSKLCSIGWYYPHQCIKLDYLTED